MDTKQQIADRIKKANNILVTVSANPSVDQLSACIGLTLVCNKLGKHATAVFSGAVPSTIEFLQPEKTIEKNTDSLRDFIISLDKSKADKLRYKVEDKVVKIFITPYRTSISERDLDFSQGDFNVDVIVALGVHNQADLDQAITAHGRILHDAAIVTLNIAPGGELGGTNWLDPGASSLSELAAELCDTLDRKLIDSQIATSFLTGIVAETGRFSNAKTSPQTMSISAELMSLGANQQLVASKLEEPQEVPVKPAGPLATIAAQPPAKPDDGTLEIEHIEDLPPPEPEIQEKPETPQIHIDEDGELRLPGITPAPTEDLPKPEVLPVIPVPQHTEGPRLILKPPTFSSELTANANAEDEELPSGSPLSLPSEETAAPLLERTELGASQSPVGKAIDPPVTPTAPVAPAEETDAPTTSLTPEVILPSPVPEPVVPPAPEPVTLPDAVSPSPVVNDMSVLDLPAATPTPQADDAASIAPSVLPPVVPPTPASTDAVVPYTPPSFAPTDPMSMPMQPSTPSYPTADVVTPTPEIVPAPTEELAPSVADARSAVAQAMGQGPEGPLAPIQALNAQTLGAPLHEDDATVSVPASDASMATPPPVPPPMLPPAQ